jgi:hypothetical protein
MGTSWLRVGIVLLGFINSQAESAVRRSVDGAMRRLAGRDCARVFADFSLEAPERAFLETIRFADDRDALRCRNGSGIVAFTAPGSHAIHVCSRRFREVAHANATLPEVVIIHEFLHVLGLGENPPTSDEITRQVMARCGP